MKFPSVAMFVLAALSSCMACSGFHPMTPSHEQLAATLATETVELVQPPSSLEDCEEGDLACLFAAVLDPTPHVYCSGTWVGKDEILTANHCTVKAPNLLDEMDYAVQDDVTTTPDGMVHTNYHHGRLVARDPSHDLALVQASTLPPEHPFARLSNDDIRPGQMAFAMGAPLGMGWSFSSGDVAQVRRTEADDGAFWVVQATTPISPGSSGCGLFDQYGDLIGVAQGHYPAGENFNIFIHRDHVRAFLAHAHAGADAGLPTDATLSAAAPASSAAPTAAPAAK